MKQVVLELSNAATKSINEQRATNGEEFFDFLRTELDVARVCPASAEDEGCWAGSLNWTSSVPAGSPGLVLQNGAAIRGNFVATSPNRVTIIVDWNGLNGPNSSALEQDRYLLQVNFHPDGMTLGGLKAGRAGVNSGWVNNGHGDAFTNLYTQ